MVYFVFWMFHLVLLTENLICLVIFYFKGWIFGDLDDVIGILDGDYVICDDFLLSQGKYLVFLRVYLIL